MKGAKPPTPCSTSPQRRLLDHPTASHPPRVHGGRAFRPRTKLFFPTAALRQSAMLSCRPLSTTNSNPPPAVALSRGYGAGPTRDRQRRPEATVAGGHHPTPRLLRRRRRLVVVMVVSVPAVLLPPVVLAMVMMVLLPVTVLILLLLLRVPVRIVTTLMLLERPLLSELLAQLALPLPLCARVPSFLEL